MLQKEKQLYCDNDNDNNNDYTMVFFRGTRQDNQKVDISHFEAQTHVALGRKISNCQLTQFTFLYYSYATCNGLLSQLSQLSAHKKPRVLN